jgi:hypothetical protein
MNADVIEFPSNKTDVLKTLQQMLDEGVIVDFIIFATNAQNPQRQYHFTATGGITLLDALQAQHEVRRLADKLDDGAPAM